MSNQLRDRLKSFSIQTAFGNGKVPEHLHEGIALYVEKGVLCGGFLTAVITNNLRGAFEYGDLKSIHALQAIVAFFYNHVPSGCCGSVEKMLEWQRHDGMEGIGRPF